MKTARQLLQRAAGLVLFVTMSVLAACGKPTSAPGLTGNVSTVREITDGAGRTVKLAAPAQRIVSLSPAATDILVAEDASAQIVGATRFCNIPTGDEKRVVRVGGVMDPDYERILTLKPDLVIVPWLADKTLQEKLVLLELPVLVLHPEGLPGVIDDIRMVGKVCGHEVEGEAKAKTMEVVRTTVLSRWKDVPLEKRPRVLIYLDDISPAPGSYVDDLLTVAGGRNVLPKGNKAWLNVSAEEALQLAPDLIIEIPSSAHAANINAKPVTTNSTTIVQLVDGAAFYHPGPDLGLALWALARAIAPARFPEAAPPPLLP